MGAKGNIPGSQLCSSSNQTAPSQVKGQFPGSGVYHTEQARQVPTNLPSQVYITKASKPSPYHPPSTFLSQQQAYTACLWL